MIPLVSPDRQKAFLAFLTPDLFPSTFDDNPSLRFELRPATDVFCHLFERLEPVWMNARNPSCLEPRRNVN